MSNQKTHWSDRCIAILRSNSPPWVLTGSNLLSLTPCSPGGKASIPLYKPWVVTYPTSLPYMNQQRLLLGMRQSCDMHTYAYACTCMHTHLHTHIEKKILPDDRTPPLYLYILVLYPWVYFPHRIWLKTEITKITSSFENPHDGFSILFLVILFLLFAYFIIYL